MANPTLNLSLQFLILTCILNPNVTHGLETEKTSNSAVLTNLNKPLTPETNLTSGTPTNEDTGMMPWFHQINIIVFVLACIMYYGAMMMIYSYLHNVSLVNQCVLVHMYKDVVASLMLIRLSLVVTGIVSSTSRKNQEVEMNQIAAKIIAFFVASGSYFLLIQMNIVSSIRLYMAKQMVLDPPMPWGNDEILAMKIIRLVVTVISLGFPIVLYSLGIYPVIYYGFIHEDNVPVTSRLFSGLLIFLVLSFLITIATEKYYKSKNPISTEAIVPKQVNYFLVSNLSLIAFVLFENTFRLLDSQIRWEVFQLMLSICGVITPSIVVLRSHKLTSYSLKFIKEIMDKLIINSIFVTPLFVSIVIYSSLSLM